MKKTIIVVFGSLLIVIVALLFTGCVSANKYRLLELDCMDSLNVKARSYISTIDTLQNEIREKNERLQKFNQVDGSGNLR